MQLSLSLASQDRAFGKAMRRIRPTLAPLIASFEQYEPVNPIHEAILIGLADGLPDDEMQIVPNRDGFFQVLCGFSPAGDYSPTNDDANRLSVIGKIRAAIAACPFTAPDKENYLEIIDRRWV